MRRREARDPRVEAGEFVAVGVALAENRLPAQPRLCAFERDELEEPASSCTGTPHSLS